MKRSQSNPLLERLMLGELTTEDAKCTLGITSLGARVRELRLDGYKIVRRWVYELDSDGKLRRTASYGLQTEKRQLEFNF